jgi:hypothetical protein
MLGIRPNLRLWKYESRTAEEDSVNRGDDHMLRKPGLILIMILLCVGAASTGIGTPAMVFMGALTVIAFLVSLAQD